MTQLSLMLVICLVSLLTVSYLSNGDSNYIIDEFDDINLPFAMESCQHHSPIGTYVIYKCPDSESDTVYKEMWEDEICPGNWSARSMVTDSSSAASSSDNIGTTSDLDSLYCGGSDDVVEISTYCDFEVPARRDVYLATDVCVRVAPDMSDVYMSIDCEQRSSKKGDRTTVYFYTNNQDCSVGTKKASYKRTLVQDECNVFLNDSETGLGYTIYAEGGICSQESKGGIVWNSGTTLIIIGIISIFGLFMN